MTLRCPKLCSVLLSAPVTSIGHVMTYSSFSQKSVIHILGLSLLIDVFTLSYIKLTECLGYLALRRIPFPSLYFNI